MDNLALCHSKRRSNILVFNLGPPRKHIDRSPLAVYARVAEAVAASEGAKKGVGLSRRAQSFLRILQKELFGKIAIGMED